MQAASTTEAVGDVFTALAHPTRRQILQDLKDGELAAGEIAARFPATGPTISRHLSVLRIAGLVTERRDANRILYALAGDRLAVSVGDFLSTVCPEQMVLRSIRPASRPDAVTLDAQPVERSKKSTTTGKQPASQKSARKGTRKAQKSAAKAESAQNAHKAAKSVQ
ncbi:metalloregulator ArsR/SmtB family transcription factor [Cryobacterium sp. SO1]|uniref:metalloregulator ArsR/SmtB family transcription factor n=1 Tax=Cryobacterium sp. SO1 TaxID=1897061 RepID=UPI001023DAA3|nr:metalloregulator ArsR/SmtB family transcription factor [Cryobacterium sp. SO1]RZI34481.1 Transcriptional repressor SdpR [Cryobacterium sp. SO1]